MIPIGLAIGLRTRHAKPGADVANAHERSSKAKNTNSGTAPSSSDSSSSDDLHTLYFQFEPLIIVSKLCILDMNRARPVHACGPAI